MTIYTHTYICNKQDKCFRQFGISMCLFLVNPPTSHPHKQFLAIMLIDELYLFLGFINKIIGYNHAVHILLCLTSFTQYNVFESCPCYCISPAVHCFLLLRSSVPYEDNTICLSILLSVPIRIAYSF